MSTIPLPFSPVDKGKATSAEFEKLVGQVHSCRKCVRMEQSRRVLSRSAGPLTAPIMFIGEAPGRLGADGSEIPFHGDKAGHNFEDLLHHVGLDRYQIFITNAVLCNPRNDDGNNAPPNRTEIQNCSNFLRRQIELVDPKIIVTLGTTSLSALSSIEAHGLSLRQNVRTSNVWNGRILIPAYHPGQRAMIHRSFANQLADYQFVREQLDRLTRRPMRISGSIEGKIYSVVDLITKHAGKISYFSLHKFYYLSELLHVERTGERITNAYIIRQKDGPYCTALHPYRLKKAFGDMRIYSDCGKLTVARNLDSAALPFEPKDSLLSMDERDSISTALEKYGDLDDSRLKTVVYLTKPMKKILRAERHEHTNFFNSPIYFV